MPPAGERIGIASKVLTLSIVIFCLIPLGFQQNLKSAKNENRGKR